MKFTPPRNTKLSTIQIDDKWSVDIDPSNNDKPLTVNRYGESVGDWEYDNFVTAMLYALIEAKTNDE